MTSRKHLSRNGYPRGIISYNMNDVVNKHRDKPKDIITVPKHEIFIICSSPRLLQSALDDLKKHLSRNGYPRGIISYNMNDVVNKHRDKPKDIITAPKKEIFIVLPYLGIQKKIVTQQVKSGISKFYGCFIP